MLLGNSVAGVGNPFVAGASEHFLKRSLRHIRREVEKGGALKGLHEKGPHLARFPRAAHAVTIQNIRSWQGG